MNPNETENESLREKWVTSSNKGVAGFMNWSINLCTDKTNDDAFLQNSLVDPPRLLLSTGYSLHIGEVNG